MFRPRFRDQLEIWKHSKRTCSPQKGGAFGGGVIGYGMVSHLIPTGSEMNAKSQYHKRKHNSETINLHVWPPSQRQHLFHLSNLQPKQSDFARHRKNDVDPICLLESSLSVYGIQRTVDRKERIIKRVRKELRTCAAVTPVLLNRYHIVDVNMPRLIIPPTNKRKYTNSFLCSIAAPRLCNPIPRNTTETS